MPIFEYHCLDCHRPFERLRAAGERDAPVTCPACGSARAKRTISAFATLRAVPTPASATGGSPSPSSSGCACGGHCGCH